MKTKASIAMIGIGAQSQSGLRRAATVAELFGITLAIARQSAARCEALATAFAHHENKLVADVFLAFAEDERKTAARIRSAVQSTGHAPRTPEAFDWVEREGLPDRAIAEAGGPWLMTPYGALALLVRKEERLFAYLVELAAEPVDPSVREWSETLGKEVLGHIAKLRLARRRARRREYRPTPIAHTIGQFRHIARAVEAGAASQAQRLAEKLSAFGQSADATLLEAMAREAADNAARLADRAAAPGIEKPSEWQLEFRTEASDFTAALRAALAQAEERFTLYTRLAEAARDDDIARCSRDFAGQAIRWLSAISARLAELHPAPPKP